MSYSFKCAIKAFTIRDLKNATTVSQLVKVIILYTHFVISSSNEVTITSSIDRSSNHRWKRHHIPYITSLLNNWLNERTFTFAFMTSSWPAFIAGTIECSWHILTASMFITVMSAIHAFIIIYRRNYNSAGSIHISSLMTSSHQQYCS